MKKSLCLFLIVFVFSVFTLGCDLLGSLDEIEADAIVNGGSEVPEPTSDRCKKENGAYYGSITFKIDNGSSKTFCADEPAEFKKTSGGIVTGFVPYYTYGLEWTDPSSENGMPAITLVPLSKGNELKENSNDFGLIVVYSDDESTYNPTGSFPFFPGYMGLDTLEKSITHYGGAGKVVKGNFSGQLNHQPTPWSEIDSMNISGSLDIVLDVMTIGTITMPVGLE